MTNRTDAAAATRALVLATARIVFSEVGYEAATIRLIAKRAQRSTGAVFCHWLGKQELYTEVYGHPPFTPEQGLAMFTALQVVESGTPDSAPPLRAMDRSAMQSFARAIIRLVAPKATAQA